jgi:hypothetical protein
MQLNLFYSSIYNATTLFIRSYTFTTCLASIGHPQVFHFLPKLLPAFTIHHAFFPIVLFLIYVTVMFWLTLVSPPYTVI